MKIIRFEQLKLNPEIRLSHNKLINQTNEKFAKVHPIYVQLMTEKSFIRSAIDL